MKPYQILGLCLTASIALAILFLTLAPAGAVQTAGIGDKAAHVLGFAALILPAACLYRRGLPWLLPLALAFGAGIEIVQPFVGRSAEFGDFLADGIGLIVGTLAGLMLRGVLLRLLPDRVLGRHWFWAMK